MKTYGALILGLVLATSAFGQMPTSPEVPILRDAALPMYPPIAKAAHVTGKVAVRVTVTNGLVRDTVILSKLDPAGQRFLETATLQNLRTWHFDAGVTRTLTVKYTYEISGHETDEPANPEVVISPSLDVRIISRPVKPTVNY
jgi:TonB family protein